MSLGNSLRADCGLPTKSVLRHSASDCKKWRSPLWSRISTLCCVQIFFAFGESAASREGACECAVFRVECGHVLVQREFELAPVNVLEQVKELGTVEVPRRMQTFEALSQKPIVCGTVGGVQAVVADHRDSGIHEERERTEVSDQCKFRHERENLFDVMILAGLVP